MRALKLALMLAGLLAIIQYIPAYYYASEFDSFVHNEVMRTRVRNQLKRDIMDRARFYSLRVRENDINITTSGAVFRVAIDYEVPVNLLVYNHELRFHTIGAGLLSQ